ncbi:MAG: ABC transporter ATP-binding protein [Deltaproteobacteria bacterium]|nr:ABC transporter ATP-binding protein [Deltaproteobacteria bacterium]
MSLFFQESVALKVEKLTMQFGWFKALTDVSLSIKKNNIFGLIGPNGAGKTTLFNLLTGVYQPTSGSVEAFGKTLLGLKPHEITRRFVARTFQNIRLFKELSVLDNVLISLDHSSTSKYRGILSSMMQFKSYRKTERLHRDRANHLLEIFNLHHRRHRRACDLPYGDQRKLEIVRALATGAKLLLLDEPAAGLNIKETQELMCMVQLIRDQFDLTILLIEHDMKLVMGVCERIAVLDYGCHIAEGTPLEIQKNERVIEAYLGKGAHA